MLHREGALVDQQRTWSTAGYRPDTQFSVWQQIIADAFVPAEVARPDAGEGFAADCGACPVGDLHLLGLSSQRQTVERSPAHVAARRADQYFLNMPVAGRGRAEQGGRSVTGGPGDLVLVDGDLPFRLDFAGPFEQLCLVIPRPLLDPLLADPAAGTGVAIRGDTGPGALVGALLRSLAEHVDTLDARQVRGVTDHLLGLVAMAVVEASEPAVRGRAALLQRALDEAERSLGDPDLDATELARRLHISPSYLTKIFATTGTPFARWLWGRRLDRAWAELSPERGDDRTITEVAHACGFVDSAHFARAFRTRFGTTPSQRRTMGQ